MRQVTIHSDGFGGKNTVILDEDGNVIDGVISAEIKIEAQKVNEVSLEMQAVALTTGGSVTEVTFRCPVCFERFQHQCDESVGNIKPAGGSANPLFDYEICGKQSALPSGFTCYINKDIAHLHHFDPKNDASWTTQ